MMRFGCAHGVPLDCQTPHKRFFLHFGVTMDAQVLCLPSTILDILWANLHPEVIHPGAERLCAHFRSLG